MYLNCLSDCVSEKVNKQPEVINETETDCLCGRNWAEDPIQGNSDLWVITCNVLRRRAVSGCLSDSIRLTQSSAVHSLGLNCPICFPPDAQLFPLHLLQQQEPERDALALVNSFTHTKCLCVAYKQVWLLHTTTTVPTVLSQTWSKHTRVSTSTTLVQLYILFFSIISCH